MQKYKVSFKGQNIYVGIDVHLKTWHVTTLTASVSFLSLTLFEAINSENNLH